MSDDFDLPPRSDRLADEEVAANQADRGDPELELESARRVAQACAADHGFGAGACAPCIAAYAQQLRAERRLMRQALERERETSRARGDRIDAAIKRLGHLVEAVEVGCVDGRIAHATANTLRDAVKAIAAALEGK